MGQVARSPEKRSARSFAPASRSQEHGGDRPQRDTAADPSDGMAANRKAEAAGEVERLSHLREILTEGGPRGLQSGDQIGFLAGA